MRVYKVIVILACVLWPGDTRAQQTAEDIDRIVDTMVRLCVGGGKQFSVGGGGTGGAEVTLRSLDVRGNLQGEFRIDKSEVEGLVDGIGNALNEVAADQASEVRDCLRPVESDCSKSCCRYSKGLGLPDLPRIVNGLQLLSQRSCAAVEESFSVHCLPLPRMVTARARTVP